MSDDIYFKFRDNGEHQDYHFSVHINGCSNGIIVFDDGEWKFYDLNSFNLLSIANKLNELNAATKADKLFGFL